MGQAGRVYCRQGAGMGQGTLCSYFRRFSDQGWIRVATLILFCLTPLWTRVATLIQTSIKTISVLAQGSLLAFGRSYRPGGLVVEVGGPRGSFLGNEEGPWLLIFECWFVVLRIFYAFKYIFVTYYH